MDSPGHPPPGTDAVLLHPIFLPNPPRYSVLCSCGHYTFYVDESERARYEHKNGAAPDIGADTGADAGADAAPDDPGDPPGRRGGEMKR